MWFKISKFPKGPEVNFEKLAHPKPYSTNAYVPDISMTTLKIPKDPLIFERCKFYTKVPSGLQGLEKRMLGL